jgi:hypothetical protein
MKITEPGIYTMRSEIYHADPVPEMSLSSTGARTLAKGTPAAYWHDRHNPKHKRVFDIGTAGHLMVLEPHLFEQKVEIIRGVTAKGEPKEDYTTADAKAKRDAAYAAGKTPLLPAEAEMVAEMRAVLLADPVAGAAFRGGAAEQSMFWRDAEFGAWRRTRPDYLPPHRRYLVDYKTSVSADPREFGKRMLDYGYHQQAAWYLDGVHAVTGEMPERFAFVVQEKTPPYLVTVCWVDQEAIEIGRELNRFAVGIFAHCLRTGEWPGYRDAPGAPPRGFSVTLPGWAVAEHQQRSEAGAFQPPRVETQAEAA